jgi:hypothetical protein
MLVNQFTASPADRRPPVRQNLAKAAFFMQLLGHFRKPGFEMAGAKTLIFGRDRACPGRGA